MGVSPPGGAQPTPAGSGSGGAGLGGAATGAAAAGASAAGGAGAWWSSLWQQHAPVVEQKIKGTVKNLKRAKLTMPVDVKVDFLNPTIETVQESLGAAWSQLPPPVQQAMPYVGLAAGTGIVVFALQQRRLNQERQKTVELQQQLRVLEKEKQELLRRVNTLKANRAPRTEVEARLANAVAEATNAAAAAADAAARAATACIIQKTA